MAAKLLVSGIAGSGKTTLLKTLEDVLVISHDGKPFSLPIPHVYVKSFSGVQELIQLVGTKVQAYKEKFGKFPKTIVFDSVSKIFDTISNNCNAKYTGFTIYSQLNKEINEFTTFLEEDVAAQGVNLVILSHATYDQDTESYKLVAQGKFAERGGFYAEVNESVFIQPKGNKRTLHLRSTKFPARTHNDDLPDSVEVSEFSLQDHINLLQQTSNIAQDYTI